MKLHCEHAGSGPPLIMAHGIFGSFENLGAVARLLARSFRLYRLDLRNHGRSPHADAMSFTDMANDIVELMDAEKLPVAALLGHSLGGKVVQTVAVNYPQRVSHLVVGDISSAGYPAAHNPMLAALIALRERRFHSRRESDQALAETIDEELVRQFLLKNLRRNDDGGDYSWRLNIAAIANNYPALRGPVPGTGQYTGPTLFLRGEKSNYIRPQDEAVIKQRFPLAEVKTLPGTTHWLHAEKPQAFVELALGQLKQ